MSRRDRKDLHPQGITPQREWREPIYRHLEARFPGRFAPSEKKEVADVVLAKYPSGRAYGHPYSAILRTATVREAFEIHLGKKLHEMYRDGPGPQSPEETDRQFVHCQFGENVDPAMVEAAMARLREQVDSFHFMVVVQYLDMAFMNRRAPTAAEIAECLRARGVDVTADEATTAIRSFTEILLNIGADGSDGAAVRHDDDQLLRLVSVVISPRHRVGPGVFDEGMVALSRYLQRRYSPRLSHTDVEEVAAEAIARMYEASIRGLIRKVENPVGYLLKIANRLAQARTAGARREGPLTPLIDDELRMLEDNDVAAEFDRLATADVIARAMTTAREDGDTTALQVATHLLDVLQRTGSAPSNRQVGRALGISHTAVAKALVRLRRYAAGPDESPGAGPDKSPDESPDAGTGWSPGP